MGDGAVGTAVAVALFDRFKTVLLAGPPGIEQLQSKMSVKGAFNSMASIELIPINSIPDSVDVVVLAVKAFHIHEVIPALSKLKNSTFVCLSNGIGFEHNFKDLSIEYAVLSMGFNRLSQSVVETSEGSLYCQAGGETAEIFNRSSIPIVFVPDIMDYRWSKWFANSIINPIAALTGLANNQLLEMGLKELIEELSLELEKLMPSDSAIINGKKLLNWLLCNSTNKCSMLQDLANKNTTEIDFLTGFALRNLPDRCPTASNLVALIKAQRTFSRK